MTPSPPKNFADVIEGLGVFYLGMSLDDAGGLLQVTTGPGLPGFEKEAGSKMGGWFAAGLILALIRRMAAWPRLVESAAEAHEHVRSGYLGKVAPAADDR